jgi:hypothetical protein
MMRWTTSRVSQFGQQDRSVAEGNGFGSSASGGGMDQGQLGLGSHRRPGLQHPLEPVDVSHGVGDRGFATGPRKAEFKRGKQIAVDDDGHQIRAPDPGVPQTFSSLEGLDLKAVMVHCRDPKIFPEPKETCADQNECELIHIWLIFRA